MKKIYLLALLCLALTQVKAQDGVLFKIKYAPNKNYQTTVGISMKVNATLSGDTALIAKLSSQGITQPVIAAIELGLNGNAKTGASGADNSFPVAIDYKVSNISVTANGKQMPIPLKITEKDMKAMGHITPDGQIKIDSTGVKKMNDTTEKKMKQMMDMVQKMIKFPDKPLKPGDSFTQDAPVNMPVSGDNKIKMNGGVTYKLISVSDGKAYFDMVPTFSVDFKIRNTAISVAGSGTGKMVYSIKDNFPLSKTGTFNMKIKVTSPKLNIEGTAVVTSNYNCNVN